MRYIYLRVLKNREGIIPNDTKEGIDVYKGIRVRHETKLMQRTFKSD